MTTIYEPDRLEGLIEQMREEKQKKDEAFYMKNKCKNYGSYHCSLVSGCDSCGIKPFW